MKQLLNQLISSGDVYDLRKLNSFLGLADKETIRILYNDYKDKWIEHGTFTYYAEDFIKYQNSAKLDNSLEVFCLFHIYQALYQDEKESVK